MFETHPWNDLLKPGALQPKQHPSAGSDAGVRRLSIHAGEVLTRALEVDAGVFDG
jgi:hypothetical protein